MKEINRRATALPAPGCDALTGILREGAQRLLTQAIDAEVDGWIEGHCDLKDEGGRQCVVRNRHPPGRPKCSRAT